MKPHFLDKPSANAFARRPYAQLCACAGLLADVIRTSCTVEGGS